ncbi:hypothetical protein A3K64_00955 [Candidatus Micrarchaeota archaeon RBG_16_36_9]|nr:MAG: hypothetical protein A3K64_00955 [Candidatus Micrarchaeota archaeon RBG_16_36_9]
MTEEIKAEEQAKIPEQKEESKGRFNLLKIRGANGKETLENISFLVIVISAIMVSIGIGFGSFIQGTVFISVFGAFFVIVGIVVYMISQFIEDKNG